MAIFNDIAAGEDFTESSNNHKQQVNDESILLRSSEASFKPVNQGPAIIKPINKSRSRRFDYQSLYDLPEDPLPEVPSAKKMKGTPLALVRSQTLSGTALSQICNGDVHSYMEPPYPPDYIIEAEATQLSTLPGLRRKTSKKVSYKTSELLPRYPITKPKDNHRKWATTEDTVKAMTTSTMAATISKTTLEKLTAFRRQEYKPYPRNSAAKHTINYPPQQPLTSIFDEECDIDQQRLTSELNFPTSYQPSDWLFNEQSDYQSNANFSPKLDDEADFVQGSSPLLDPRSIYNPHNDGYKPLDPFENDTAMFDLPTALHDLKFGSKGIGALKNVCGLNNQISLQYSIPADAEFGCEDTHRLLGSYDSATYHDQRQDHSSRDHEISQNEVKKLMADIKMDEQLPEIVSEHFDSMEDGDFPFDEEDEAQLAKLVLNTDHVTCPHSTSHEVFNPHSHSESPFPDLTEIPSHSIIPSLDKQQKSTDHRLLPQLYHTQSHSVEILFSPGSHEVVSSISHEIHQDGNFSEARHAAFRNEAIDWTEDDEYAPMQPFARPEFPARVRDRSSIPGISANLILQTCFRIGEAVRVSTNCNKVGQDAIIELFARVTKSSREIGKTKQHFKFADLFHDRPPYIMGVLENFKIFPLQETESSMLLSDGRPEYIVRCLGRLKRDLGYNDWILHILNIRSTDWEEVRWTQAIAGAGMAKSEGWGSETEALRDGS